MDQSIDRASSPPSARVRHNNTNTTRAAAATNGHYWPGQIQDVNSAAEATVVTVQLLPLDGNDEGAPVPPAVAATVLEGAPIRAGETLAVDLAALHEGRPLPLQDPKVRACGGGRSVDWVGGVSCFGGPRWGQGRGD